MNNNYPHLRHLLGAYLHQDWSTEFSTPADALKAFQEREPPECVQGVCKELREVIPRVQQMSEPAKFLGDELWCYYLPSADGLTVANWLIEVQKVMKCD